MIRFHVFGIEFSLPLLTLLFPPLCMRLGMKLHLSGLVLALSLHELAHMLAAKATGVEIIEIRLTPFGGSARMENPYGLRPIQLAAVAAAGPAVNLLCAVVFAALAQWNLLLAHTAAAHVRIHLTLFAFNLLPALPLDGGRLLFCLLQGFTGRSLALKVCIIIGKMLAMILACMSLFGFITVGRLNLCLILMAIFILISVQDERDALCESKLCALHSGQLDKVPVRFFQMLSESTVLDAMLLTRPKEASWFLLFKNGKPAGLLDGRTIAEFIRSGGASNTELGRLPMLQFMQESNRSAQVLRH